MADVSFKIPLLPLYIAKSGNIEAKFIREMNDSTDILPN